MTPGGLGGPGSPGGMAGGMRPRPGGGFNSGMGQFGEHLDESAMQQAMTQKSLGQQQANPMAAAAAAAGAKQASQPPSQQQPREVGSLGDELIKRPLHDIWNEIKQFFSLNTWLGIKADTDDPQKKQKLAAFHRRFQKLEQEDQAEVKRKFQLREQQAKQQKEAEERKKIAEQKQKEQSSIVAPSGSKKGPIGPASGKSRKSNAISQLTQNRQQLSNAQGAN